jgi:DNA-binding NtrC family response regulator
LTEKDDEQEDDLEGLVINLPEMERNPILRALRLTKGNRSQVARLLDISVLGCCVR